MTARMLPIYLLVVAFSMAGCGTTYKTKGKLAVYEEAFPSDFDKHHRYMLKPGPTTITFNSKPWFYNHMIVDSWHFGFKARVRRMTIANIHL
jgi:hypothetical protein